VSGTLNGESVTGTAWMDHEWFTSLLETSQQGWDWFSIQLDNNTQLMLFQIRRKDGTIDSHSSGTFIAADGRATALGHSDINLLPVEYWTSKRSGSRYPIKWKIAIPSLNLSLDCTAAIPDQELVSEDRSGPTYWEGAVQYTGTTTGVGYLEMTGYGSPVKM
jgi:predicted secreted hydrolase